MKLFSRQSLTYKVKRYSKYPLVSGVVILLGFLREMTIAAHYGLGPELDVFAIVLTLYIFFGTQIGNSFESVVISEMAHKKRDEINRTLSVLVLFIGSVYLLFVFLGYGYLTSYLGFVYPGLTSNQLALADDLMIVFFVAIIATVFIGVFRGNLYIKEKFTLGLLGGSFISFFVIISVFLFSEKFGIVSLAYGYSLGSALFMLVLFMRVYKTYDFKMSISIQDIKKSGFIWKALSLIIVGEVLFQLTYTAQRSIASGLEAGAVSSLYYAMAIVQVVATLFVAPLTTVLFPKIRRCFNDNKTAGFKLLNGYIVFFFLFGSGAAVAVFFLSEMIVEFAFLRGEFTMDDAQRTAALISILIFILPSMCVDKLIRYGYYSLNNYRAPIVGHSITWLVLVLSAPYFISEYSEAGLGYAIVLSVGVSSLSLMTGLLWTRKNARV